MNIRNQECTIFAMVCGSSPPRREGAGPARAQLAAVGVASRSGGLLAQRRESEDVTFGTALGEGAPYSTVLYSTARELTSNCWGAAVCCGRMTGLGG